MTAPAARTVELAQNGFIYLAPAPRVPDAFLFYFEFFKIRFWWSEETA
jgi:hypothetical protein